MIKIINIVNPGNLNDLLRWFQATIPTVQSCAWGATDVIGEVDREPIFADNVLTVFGVEEAQRAEVEARLALYAGMPARESDILAAERLGQAVIDIQTIQGSALAYALLTGGDASAYTVEEITAMQTIIVRWVWAVSDAPYPDFTTGAKQ